MTHVRADPGSDGAHARVGDRGRARRRFGTGFSSLDLLRSLPLQGVKIDRSLIEPLPDADAAAVVRAICDLARVLDLDVVAEGIESGGQAVAAAQAGCHVLQGTLIARAMAPPRLRSGRHRRWRAPDRTTRRSSGPWRRFQATMTRSTFARPAFPALRA